MSTNIHDRGQFKHWFWSNLISVFEAPGRKQPWLLFVILCSTSTDLKNIFTEICQTDPDNFKKPLLLMYPIVYWGRDMHSQKYGPAFKIINVRQTLVTSKTMVTDVLNRLFRQKHAFEEFNLSKEMVLPLICKTNNPLMY